jgi:hypothetical protein
MLVIKDMELPKSCKKCPFKAMFPNTGLKNGVCNDLHLPFKRHQYCPLIEIITCKDCKYYRNRDGDEWCTTHSFKDNKFFVREDYHCADAERKNK